MLLQKNAKIALLAGIPLFSGLSKKDLGLVAMVADEMALPEGKVLIREGDRGREFFVLLDGTVDVSREGRRLNRQGPGSFFGEIALIADVPRTATVTAETPLRVLVVTHQAFANLVKTKPAIALKVLAAVGERLAAEKHEA